MRYLIAFVLIAGLNAPYAAASDGFQNLQERSVERRTTNDSDCTYGWFTQQIDHFGQYNGTFQQRYNLVTEFFKPGGPIFFFQGEESIDLDCVDSTILYSWAQQLNGIAVSMEHRYFGQSAPFGASNPITQHDEFQYLTLDNVMADAACFVESLKQNITGAESSKAIVASGSYGGFLATVFRQNHPESFYGAIASAPPVEALSNSTTDLNNFNWAIWVNNVYQDRSLEASTNIKNAIAVLEERFQSGNVSSLKGELGLCSSPRNSSDFLAVYSWVRTILILAPEFNYATLRPGRAPAALTLDKVVNIALTQKDPIQLLNETLWMWFGPPPGIGLSCIDWQNATPAVEAVPGIQTSIFSYIGCKYFPMYAAAYTPPGIILPAMDLATNAIQSCDETYNISTPSEKQLREQYRFTQADLRNSTRIIFSLGQYDPTNGVSPNEPGVNAPALTADRNVSRILYTSNMAHREDLFAPVEGDRETVVQARQIELESIKGWLGMYNL